MYVANAYTLVTSQPVLVGLKLIGPCRDKHVHVYVCMYVCMCRFQCLLTAIYEHLPDHFVSKVEAVVQGRVAAMVALVQVCAKALHKKLAHLCIYIHTHTRGAHNIRYISYHILNTYIHTYIHTNT